MSDISFLLTGYAKIFPFPLFHKIFYCRPRNMVLAPLWLLLCGSITCTRPYSIDNVPKYYAPHTHAQTVSPFYVTGKHFQDAMG